MHCSALINFPRLALIFSFQGPKRPYRAPPPVCIAQPLMKPFDQGKGFRYQVSKLHSETFPLLLYQYLISIDSFPGPVSFHSLCKWTFSITEPFEVYVWNIFKPNRIAFKQVTHWFPLTLNYFSPDFPEVFPETFSVVHWTQKTNRVPGWVGVTGTWETRRLFSRSLSLVQEIRHFEKSP